VAQAAQNQVPEISIPNQRELTRRFKVLRRDREKDVSEGEADPRTPHRNDDSHNE